MTQSDSLYVAGLRKYTITLLSLFRLTTTACVGDMLTQKQESNKVILFESYLDSNMAWNIW